MEQLAVPAAMGFSQGFAGQKSKSLLYPYLAGGGAVVTND